jgi:type I restriction enzyme S subunit
MPATRTPIGELLQEVPRQPKIKRSEYQENGRFPIVDQSQADIAGFTDDESWLYKGELPVVIFGDHTRVLKFVDFPFCVGADGTQLLRPVADNDIRYFYYALRNVDLTNYGYERHFKYLKEEQIPVPPLPVQRRIAGILSAYDELMENNRRRIRLLEAMARAPYREWFVRPCQAGKLPKGWEMKRILEFGSVITGKTPSKAKSDFYGEDLPFVKTPDMHGNTFILAVGERLSAAGAESQANKTLPTGSICVSCIGTIGVVSITTEDCQTNQQINSVVLANEHYREFLFFRLQDGKQALENLGSAGATMGNVNKGKFEALEVTTPPDALLNRYHQFAAPLFSEMLILSRQTVNLRRTRDLLLPRLLSGKVGLNGKET